MQYSVARVVNCPEYGISESSVPSNCDCTCVIGARVDWACYSTPYMTNPLVLLCIWSDPLRNLISKRASLLGARARQRSKMGAAFLLVSSRCLMQGRAKGDPQPRRKQGEIGWGRKMRWKEQRRSGVTFVPFVFYATVIVTATSLLVELSALFLLDPHFSSSLPEASKF